MIHENIEINADTIAKKSFLSVMANGLTRYNQCLDKESLTSEDIKKIISGANELHAQFQLLKKSVLEEDISIVSQLEEELTTIINTIQSKLDNNEFNGQDGSNGSDGIDGKDGENGFNGQDGKSAYELAVSNGYDGTVVQWLSSLKGDVGTTDFNDLVNKDYIEYELNELVMFENGWVRHSSSWNCSIIKTSDHTIILNAMISSGVNNTIICILPSHLRPLKNILNICQCSNGENIRVDIRPDGSVFLSSDGTRTNQSWVFLNFTYGVANV